MPQKNLRDTYLFICDSTALPGSLNLLNLNAHSFSGGGDNWLAIKVGEGTISWSEARAITYKRDRGRLTQVDGTAEVYVGEAIAGDESPMEVSFDIVFESYINPDASGAGPVEAIKGVNAASVYPNGTNKPDQIVDGNAACEVGNWSNADTVDPCGPWSVNVVIQFHPDCSDATKIELLWFPRFRWDQMQFDMSEGQISCTGKCTALKPVKLVSGFTDWATN